MKTRFVVALALVAALVAGHGAFAFQEQKGSTPAPAEAAPAPAEAAPGDAKVAATDAKAAPKKKAARAGGPPRPRARKTTDAGDKA